ncbi:imidazole glycerol phosphate synthase subunit HisH [Heyndrickxia sp. NPDC080065]|uniref:imidazole glycerol phosphate synthase subunit HisH n=1 Tax=Heyndrickxia sp. NPDC080065 TaxID=3390568 RepID=UPI003CFC7644
MIAIVDYGMGNIASISNAFKSLGYDICISDRMEDLEKASHIILPGVGSFQAAASEIERRGLREVLQHLAITKPILGICLGMQLLFTEGLEGGRSKGLNLIPGTVEKIKTESILPHIGWNTLNFRNSEYADYQNKYMYFVHSYVANTPSEYIIATTNYGANIPSIVRNGNVIGMQFHPEKSGEMGRKLIQAFLQAGEKAKMGVM